MTFLYSFFTFFQPGILFPQLAALKPILLLSLIALFFGALRMPAYPRSTIFGNISVKYLIGFVLVQVISVYYSGMSSMLENFLYWYAYIAFILVSVFLITSIKDIERFILGMILGGEFIVIYGIYAVFYHLPSSIGGRAGAYGMYENHNDYTFLIIQILPFTYMMMKRSNNSLFKLLLRFMFLSQIAGVLLSQSRGGMIALLLELGLIYIYTTKARIGLFKMLILGTIAFGAMAYQIQHRDESQGDSYTTADAKGSRFELWDAGFNMFITNPILGVGSQRFGEYSRAYGEISHDNRGKNAHNTYIEIIATTGLIGVFCFYGFIKNSIRQMKELISIDKTSEVGMYSMATLIAIYAILVRAFFDSKTHDWSFYTLCVIAVSLYAYNAYIQSTKEVKEDLVTS